MINGTDRPAYAFCYMPGGDSKGSIIGDGIYGITQAAYTITFKELTSTENIILTSNAGNLKYVRILNIIE